MALTITDIDTNTVHLSENPIYVTVNTSLALGTNYQLLLKVISVDNVFPDPSPDVITPDENDNALFEISGIVNLPVDYDFEYPVASAYIQHPFLVLDIQLIAGEYYIDGNGDPQEVWDATPTQIRILKGGLSSHQLSVYNDGDSNFHEQFITAGRFLTWQPFNKVVPVDAPEKLWFLVLAGQTVATKYFLELFYTDGSSDSTNTDINISQDKLVEFNPLKDASILADSQKTLDYIEYFLSEDGINPYSEKRRFTIDHNYYEQEHFIYFVNTLGGIDCLWCNGKFQKKLNTTTVVSTRAQPRGASQKIETLPVTSKTGQRKWEINTGFKSKEEIEALEDFLESKKMWLINDALIIPVYIEDKEQLLYDPQQDLDSLEFVLLEAH